MILAVKFFKMCDQSGDTKSHALAQLGLFFQRSPTHRASWPKSERKGPRLNVIPGTERAPTQGVAGLAAFVPVVSFRSGRDLGFDDGALCHWRPTERNYREGRGGEGRKPHFGCHLLGDDAAA